ncbi:Nramp family divalent metal transporter [Actinomycetospora sp. CA-101289]|uniref:Nramp family divalent metal transporter n=1 Tax=Actinomycetospora sp. CA-101289 TaxID=3239893 RepID=UPI003D96D759
MLQASPAPAPGGPPRPSTRRGPRLLRLAGPGAIVAVAYVDPGNVATNVEAGARFGPALLWVVGLAALAGMLVQHLAAKLGAATGRSLPELCRERYPQPVVRLLWAQAEVVAMATDLAEIVGGAIALHLLLGVPLLAGALVTAAVGVLVLGLRPDGRRHLATAFAIMLLALVAAFAVQAAQVGVTAADVATGLVPGLAADGAGGVDPRAVLLATGIVGATVMPHVVYLHSALTRDAAVRPRRHRRDVVVSLSVAAVVNMAVLLVAAAALHVPGTEPLADTIEGAYAVLGRHGGAATLFAGALLVAALASACTGVHAGDAIMTGFLRRRIPIVLRRAVTVVPALVVLTFPVDPTRALVISQVVLAVGLPFALVPLLHLTADHTLMGRHVNRRSTTVAGGVVAATVSALAVSLLVA